MRANCRKKQARLGERSTPPAPTNEGNTMKKFTKHSLLAIVAATIGLSASFAQAQTAADRV